MILLGLSAYYNAAAACIIRDGIILATAQEERFTRIKHDPSFPQNAIKYCLNYSGIEIHELDAVVFYNKPLLILERLLETYYAFAPKGMTSFLALMPVWIKEKIFLKSIIRRGLKKIGNFDRRKTKLLFPEHHLSHAASAFFPSPFEEAAILTIDSMGEWATTSIGHGNLHNLKIIKELRFPHSLGLFYSSFTYYLGFMVNSGEYKLMGLASYGDPDSGETKQFDQIIRNHLIDMKEDGSLHLNQRYFRYATGKKMTEDQKWEKLFGFPRRKPDTGITQHHCNLALAMQKITEEAILGLARETKRLTKSDHLCIAGGVGLNYVANREIINSGLFKEVFIQPAAGDAGSSLGAALAAYYIYYRNKRKVKDNKDLMQGTYLGRILADARYEDMQNKLNESVKCNEKFGSYAMYFSGTSFGIDQHIKINNMEVLTDLWEFLKLRKKWWLMPTVLFLILIAALGIGISSSTIAPFVYLLF
ncbi:MAG: hypothetical protein IMY70_06320 [Bacteroidetes bacterium]|nr:hypothetical protein [Bacteroidota bacterium]